MHGHYQIEEQKIAMFQCIFRRAFSVAIAVFIGVWAGFYFSMGERFWILAAIMMVMQTAVGSLLRQGLQRFLAILASVLIGTLLLSLITYQGLLTTVAITLFITLFFIDKRRYTTSLSLSMIAAITLLIAMLSPYISYHLLSLRLYNVILGTIIGLVIGLLVFPERADILFRKEIASTLTVFSQYLTTTIELLYKKKGAETRLQQQRFLIENALTTYPGWVYHSGFDVALRQGYRHFLIRTEQIEQILFVMHGIARHNFQKNVLTELQNPLLQCIDQLQLLIAALITVLNLKKLETAVDDMEDTLHELEQALKKVVPNDLELLDLSKDYILLVEFIYSLKDFRITLLKLAEALR